MATRFGALANPAAQGRFGRLLRGGGVQVAMRPGKDGCSVLPGLARGRRKEERTALVNGMTGGLL